jgi:hypothetical protein
MLALVPIVVATVVVVVVGVALLSRRGLLPPLDEPIPIGVAVTVFAAALSFGAAAANNAEIGSHLARDPTIGAVIAVVAVFQGGWGVLYLAMPSGGMAALGLLANDLILLLWAWSRTLGLPFGHPPWTAEPIALRDATAALFEVLLILLLAVRLAPQARRALAWPIPFRDAATVTTFGLLLIAAAAGAVVSGNFA